MHVYFTIFNILTIIPAYSTNIELRKVPKIVSGNNEVSGSVYFCENGLIVVKQAHETWFYYIRKKRYNTRQYISKIMMKVTKRTICSLTLFDTTINTLFS